MAKIEVPENWEKMHWGEKLIWLFEKQKEVEAQVLKADESQL